MGVSQGSRALPTGTMWHHPSSQGQHRNLIWPVSPGSANPGSSGYTCECAAHMYTRTPCLGLYHNSSPASVMRKSRRPTGSWVVPPSVESLSLRTCWKGAGGTGFLGSGTGRLFRVPALHCGSLCPEACGLQGLCSGSVLDERPGLLTSVGACYSGTYPTQACKHVVCYFPAKCP